MLDQEMAAQLQQYMGMLRRPITITATLGDDEHSADMRGLLEQIAAMSDQITLRLDGNSARKPSFSLGRPDAQQQRWSLPRFRWDMNSPRWCWRCCGRAATRPRSMRKPSARFKSCPVRTRLKCS